MNAYAMNSFTRIKLVLLIASSVLAVIALESSGFGFCEEKKEEMATPGGVHESRDCHGNNNEIDSLARFAVEEHNKKENAMVEFGRVVKAKEQVVAGTLHHLTIEAVDAGKKKLYEAKVWVKPWLNFKELQEFKHVSDVSPFTKSDLGAKSGSQEPGWKQVPVDDPSVEDAANHALKTLQQRSNSLFPYELQEVVHAQAEVDDDLAKFDMVLKVKRGNAEEKMKVQVHKSHEGTYNLHHMAPHE